MADSDTFEFFEKLIEIEILCEKCKVPEDNTLLRCFQYLSVKTISYGDFAGTAIAPIAGFGWKTPSKDKPVLSCRTKIQDKMKIVRMSREINLS